MKTQAHKNQDEQDKETHAKNVQRVFAERQRFDAVLSDLIKTELAGRFVVFRAGKVVSVHDTREEARNAGLRAFGHDGGQLITKVAPMETVALSPIY